MSTQPNEGTPVKPEHNDMLCIILRGEWSLAGDRFHAMDGERVISAQHFSGGQVRFLKRPKSDFRILRGTTLHPIA